MLDLRAVSYRILETGWLGPWSRLVSNNMHVTVLPGAVEPAAHMIAFWPRPTIQSSMCTQHGTGRDTHTHADMWRQERVWRHESSPMIAAAQGQLLPQIRVRDVSRPNAPQLWGAAVGGEAKKNRQLVGNWAGWEKSFLTTIGNWLAGSRGAVSNAQYLTVLVPRRTTPLT